MRLFEKLKFVQTYEHAAVFYNDCRYGGVNNTDIPNYIYRWSERDVEKTINVYAPYADHNFFYSYSTAFPCTPDLEKKGIIKYVFLKLAKPFYWLFVLNAVMLGYCGSKPPEGIYPLLSLIGTGYYFGYFLVILPILSKFERPLPLPQGIGSPVTAHH
jgi:hypothetical protein